MTSRNSKWLAAACMAAMSCVTSVASAQDGGAEGIVRISGGRTNVQQASFGHHGGYGYSCPPGNGGCPNCYYGGGYCHGGFFSEHYCSNSPDHGYSPPAKYPLHRRGAEYTAYFPNQWYGTPGAQYASGFPVTYQPTDTTQLGYYYQHVPFWQPSPGKMPQRPIPAQWHIVAPTVSASNFHGASWAGYPPYGGGGVYMWTPCHSCQLFGCQHGAYSNYECPPTSQNQAAPTNQAPQTQPTPVPVETSPSPEAAVPPIPRQFEASAESGNIRRALF